MELWGNALLVACPWGACIPSWPWVLLLMWATMRIINFATVIFMFLRVIYSSSCSRN